MATTLLASHQPTGLDDTIWDTLVSDYWNRAPFLIRNVFGSPVSDSQILSLYRAFRERLRAIPLTALPDHDVRHCYYFATWDHSIPVEGIDPLPLESENDIGGYYSRVKNSLGSDFCVALTDLQACSIPLWPRIRACMQPLIDRVGHPPYRARCASLLGAYEATPSGVHVDSFHSFTFVLRGHKRYHLWHKDYVHNEAPELAGAKNAPSVIRGPLGDYTQHLHKAQTFDVRAGDFIYFPNPDYFHIVENKELSVTFLLMWDTFDQLASRERAMNHQWLSASISDRAKSVPPARAIQSSKLPEALQSALSRYHHVQEAEDFCEYVWKRWLERRSRLSFQPIPEFPPIRLDSDELLVADPQAELDWIGVQSGRLLCGANGQTWEIDSGMESLLWRIISLEPFSISSLVGLAATSVDREEIRKLVEECARVGAITRVTT